MKILVLIVLFLGITQAEEVIQDLTGNYEYEHNPQAREATEERSSVSEDLLQIEMIEQMVNPNNGDINNNNNNVNSHNGGGINSQLFNDLLLLENADPAEVLLLNALLNPTSSSREASNFFPVNPELKRDTWIALKTLLIGGDWEDVFKAIEESTTDPPATTTNPPETSKKPCATNPANSADPTLQTATVDNVIESITSYPSGSNPEGPYVMDYTSLMNEGAQPTLNTGKFPNEFYNSGFYPPSANGRAGINDNVAMFLMLHKLFSSEQNHNPAVAANSGKFGSDGFDFSSLMMPGIQITNSDLINNNQQEPVRSSKIENVVNQFGDMDLKTILALQGLQRRPVSFVPTSQGGGNSGGARSSPQAEQYYASPYNYYPAAVSYQYQYSAPYAQPQTPPSPQQDTTAGATSLSAPQPSDNAASSPPQQPNNYYSQHPPQQQTNFYAQQQPAGWGYGGSMMNPMGMMTAPNMMNPMGVNPMLVSMAGGMDDYMKASAKMGAMGMPMSADPMTISAWGGMDDYVKAMQKLAPAAMYGVNPATVTPFEIQAAGGMDDYIKAQKEMGPTLAMMQSMNSMNNYPPAYSMYYGSSPPPSPTAMYPSSPTLYSPQNVPQVSGTGAEPEPVLTSSSALNAIDPAPQPATDNGNPAQVQTNEQDTLSLDISVEELPNPNLPEVSVSSVPAGANPQDAYLLPPLPFTVTESTSSRKASPDVTAEPSSTSSSYLNTISSLGNLFGIGIQDVVSKVEIGIEEMMAMRYGKMKEYNELKMLENMMGFKSTNPILGVQQIISGVDPEDVVMMEQVSSMTHASPVRGQAAMGPAMPGATYNNNNNNNMMNGEYMSYQPNVGETPYNNNNNNYFTSGVPPTYTSTNNMNTPPFMMPPMDSFSPPTGFSNFGGMAGIPSSASPSSLVPPMGPMGPGGSMAVLPTGTMTGAASGSQPKPMDPEDIAAMHLFQTAMNGELSTPMQLNLLPEALDQLDFNDQQIMQYMTMAKQLNPAVSAQATSMIQQFASFTDPMAGMTPPANMDPMMMGPTYNSVGDPMMMNNNNMGMPPPPSSPYSNSGVTSMYPPPAAQPRGTTALTIHEYAQNKKCDHSRQVNVMDTIDGSGATDSIPELAILPENEDCGVYWTVSSSGIFCLPKEYSSCTAIDEEGTFTFYVTL